MIFVKKNMKDKRMIASTTHIHNSPKQILFVILIMSIMTFCMALTQHNSYDFSDTEKNSTLTLSSNARFKPEIQEGHIEIVKGGWSSNHNNSVLFPDIISGETAFEFYSFTLHLTKGAKGAGLALVNTQQTDFQPIEQDWTLPNFPNSFGMGINVYNPQTSHWFDEYGNFFGRPEREISLHWNEREIFRMMSPVEFRSDFLNPTLSKFDLQIEYITAGANITIAINDTTILFNHFIAEMTQYEKRIVFGGSTNHLTTNVYLTNLNYQTIGTKPVFEKISSLKLLTDEIFHAGRRDMAATVIFPENTHLSDTVILTLDLGSPIGGYCAWDVGAAIYLTDEYGDKFEIQRYITPYHRGWIWKVDISHFLPLFSGEKTISAHVSTWETEVENPIEQKGWKVNATLDFYAGADKLVAYEVHNLWNGTFEYGDPNNPMSDHLPDFEIDIPSDARSGLLRVVVTGHGMGPNSEGAGEFRPSDRTIIINGIEHHNLLWKTDCYLNPCRPQGGTWKFDRAGWAPGDIVAAWEIKLDSFLGSGTLNLSYRPDDYINFNKGETWEPNHKFGSQVIFYR
jgi:hypothetical protein